MNCHLDDLHDHESERDQKVGAQCQEAHLALAAHHRALEARQSRHAPVLAVRCFSEGVLDRNLIAVPAVLDDEMARDACADHDTADQHRLDLPARDSGKEDACRENDRQEHEYPDDDAGEDIELLAVHPWPEHGLVVAQQEKEHARTRKQDARKHLDTLGQKAQRNVRCEHQRSRKGDEQQVADVEALCLADRPVKRVFQVENVTGCGTSSSEKATSVRYRRSKRRKLPVLTAPMTTTAATTTVGNFGNPR